MKTIIPFFVTGKEIEMSNMTTNIIISNTPETQFKGIENRLALLCSRIAELNNVVTAMADRTYGPTPTLLGSSEAKNNDPSLAPGAFYRIADQLHAAETLVGDLENSVSRFSSLA